MGHQFLPVCTHVWIYIHTCMYVSASIVALLLRLCNCFFFHRNKPGFCLGKTTLFKMLWGDRMSVRLLVTMLVCLVEFSSAGTLLREIRPHQNMALRRASFLTRPTSVVMTCLHNTRMNAKGAVGLGMLLPFNFYMSCHEKINFGPTVVVVCLV
jgi:hypothetical protein